MATSPPETELVDPVADEHLSIAPGAHFVVRLTENPTTGYRWHYTLTGSGAIESFRDDYAPHGQLPGSAGYRSICFRALRPGSSAVQFQLRRAWERKPPLKAFDVSVDVARSEP